MRMRFLFALVAAAALIGLPQPSPGCGFCFSLEGNPFALPHPRAIEIAVATRKAIDQGLLQGNPLLDPRALVLQESGRIALDRVPATTLVLAWARERPVGSERRKSLIVHVLFVDTSETCGVDFRGGMVLTQPRPSAHCDGRVVTTKAVFQALRSGKMGWEEAIRRGLLVPEGKEMEPILALAFRERR